MKLKKAWLCIHKPDKEGEMYLYSHKPTNVNLHCSKVPYQLDDDDVY